MPRYTYSPSGPNGSAASYYLWADAGLSIPASLFDANGNPLSSNQLNLNPDETWPVFQSDAAPLWFRDTDGTKAQLVPGPNYTNPQTVTGAKGGNAALGSLIQALIAAGIPIVDNTGA